MRSLAELYNQHEGKTSDKWELYLREYDRLLSPYRESSISLLEIGIQNGESLEIWSQLFANAKKLVGCDINQACGDLAFSDPRISVVIGDACAEQTKNAITKQSKSFDLIIDDGSHKSADIVKTFLLYFPMLREGGVFVVEDLHCSYWQEFEGGLFYPHSSISFFKTLADLVNYEHWGVSKTPASLISGFEKKYDITADDQIFSQIHSIEFLNSVCVIRKESKPNNELGKRVVIGKHDDVVQGMLASSGKRNKVADQSLNAWTSMENSPAEQYEDLSQAVTERDGEIANLNQAVTERDGEIANLNQAVTERDGRIQNLTNKIHKIRSSISWRVSAPVRWVGWGIRRVKNLSRLPSIALKRGGGVKNTPRKVLDLYRREGISGIRRRIAWALNYEMSSQKSHTAAILLDPKEVARDVFANQQAELTSELAGSVITELPYQPLVSIIVPVYDTPLKWLRRTVESLQEQFYANWELCIVDDCSPKEDQRRLLNEMAKSDPRIRLAVMPANGGISAASNLALEMA